MRKLIPFLAVVIAVSTLFIGTACRDAQRAGREATQTGTGTMDVERVIKDRFNADPQLSAADIDINADPDSREVKLSGTVNSQDVRQRAVQIARNAMPGFTVTDSITVEPKEMARTEEEEGNQGKKRGQTDSGMEKPDEEQRNQDQPVR